MSEDSLAVKTEDTLMFNQTPNYTIKFFKDTGEIGCLDFNGPAMVFTGEAEESAKVFFDWIAKSFSQRLEEERRKGDHHEKLVDDSSIRSFTSGSICTGQRP